MTEYEPHLGLVEKSFEITDLFKQSVKIVAMQVNHYNAIANPSVDDQNDLAAKIEDFNYDQKYHAVKGQCSSPTELVDLWRANRATPQIKIVQHSANHKYGVTFYTSYLKFIDFYSVHKHAFPQYFELKQVLSSFCHHLFNGILASQNGDQLANYRIYISRGSHNPYTAYSLSREWDDVISFTHSTTRGKIKTTLGSIAQYFFPEYQMRFLPTTATIRIIRIVTQRLPIERIAEVFMNLVWLTAHGELFGNTYSSNHQITRHIAWCANEYKRRCIKLDIECHSSQNCPFYRESQSKKR